MKVIACTCLVFLSALVTATQAGSWGYGETHGEVYGPADWTHVAPQCAGQHQSPVNIENATKKKDLPELNVIHLAENGRIVGNITNNGHAPTVTFDKNLGGATLKGGPLQGEYDLEQFHFHFGCASDKGSEHTVKGKAFSAELHLVFYNTKYADFSTAADKPDGLAVVGVFLKKRRRGKKNPVLKRLTDKMPQIANEGASVNFDEGDHIDLDELVPDLAPYYIYKGSLTTPNCYESVQWIVLRKKIPVSEKQLKKFRKLEAQHGYEDGKMCNNFRPTQPINGRDIYKVFE